MSDELKSDFTGQVLRQFLGMSEEDYTENLKDGEDFKPNASEILSNLLAAKIQSVKATETEKLEKVKNDQYSRGKKEALTNYEKQVKELFGVEADLTGEELLKQIAQKTTEPSTTSTSNEDFIKEVKRMQDEFKLAMEQKDQALEDFKQEVQQNKINEQVASMALNHLTSGKKKPVLPKDDKVRTNWLNTYRQKLLMYNYLVGENNEFIPLDSNNEPLKDEHDNIIGFEKHISDIASEYFTFEEQSPRPSLGSDQPQPQAQTGDIAEARRIALANNDIDTLKKLDGPNQN